MQNEMDRNRVTQNMHEKKIVSLTQEIAYLEKKRSNIPLKLASIRDEMAEALGLDFAELPFAGELIRVKDRAWQGAIERVMHGFSLSLLVKERDYKAVSEYVNATHLGAKLVYLKVDTKSQEGEFFERAKNSLLTKIEVKADSHLFDRLTQMLQERFDMPCVESLEEFRKFKKALTQSGQFKSSYSRHEKDDRFNIDDKRHWSLGWENGEKLAALRVESVEIGEKLEYLSLAIKEAQAALKTLSNTRDTLRDLLRFKSFEMIDWYRYSKRVESIKEELVELEKSSDIIQTLQKRLKILQEESDLLKPKSESYSKSIGNLEGRLEGLEGELLLLAQESEVSAALQESLDKRLSELVQEKLTLTNIKSREQLVRNSLQSGLDSLSRKLATRVEHLLSAMNSYTNRFTVESQEFDASLESLEDFRAKLSGLKRDDLPQFEQRFKVLFKEKTIQKTAMIQAELEHQAKEIESKIAKINSSLEAIEYNTGTFISLVVEPSNIKEIREFQQELKSAISYAFGDDNSYDEAKFLQIKSLIDRFNAREGFSDADKKWRHLVTDVRNWYNFSASECYMSDGSEKEYYAHSGGKSGGQKEKLAYTVLASSLAFQFGLEYNEVRSRSFRFVMIDEAFGKGSDESTKYALRLFEKLNLQLLVITPKTKINVIENFVRSVHFVHNEDGMHSSLLSMSIEDYQKKSSV